MDQDSTLHPLALLCWRRWLRSPAPRLQAAEGQSPPKEKDLIAILQSGSPRRPTRPSPASNWPFTAARKRSAALAPLLADPELASSARIALEAIPGPAADAALRKAIDSLKGELLVGTINSIGVRRDAAAVDPLTGRLKDPDAEVASAAAVALGHIGNDRRDQRAPAIVGRRLRRRSSGGCRGLHPLWPNACWPTASRARRSRFTTRFAAPTFPSNESSRPPAARFLPARRTAFRCSSSSSARPTRDCS